MIFELDNQKTTNKEIESLIGRPLSVSQKLSRKSYGSSLYNLRTIKLFESLASELPTENSRCNFEKFERGILLRINDKQKLYATPLDLKLVNEIRIIRGDERLHPIGLTATLIHLGVKKETVKKYRFLSGGHYHERFKLIIKTNTAEISMDNNDSNYRAEKEFFRESMFDEKIEII